MNYGLIPVSVYETLYRESGKFGGRQLLVAAFFLSFIINVLSHRLFLLLKVITNINLLLSSFL